MTKLSRLMPGRRYGSVLSIDQERLVEQAEHLLTEEQLLSILKRWHDQTELDPKKSSDCDKGPSNAKGKEHDHRNWGILAKSQIDIAEQQSALDAWKKAQQWAHQEHHRPTARKINVSTNKNARAPQNKNVAESYDTQIKDTRRQLKKLNV
ncbi:hypothetical protein SERLADRAFT_441809 [Serpula lacrymans var. lacrymans S7.9]|uniref:Uncharacterized protein n=1 Tax=Serpula lacrymans var. lacrymans (strain S7.9) TaxID=578457 RepID=F8P7Q9_SERL9|nr:uncharacterized protein SERLADRAFT_441809 [Serpula lacrymans var. lacrymans S7.9]EGO20467.1 hypothetical protein SERLADRAFT_441809 [Serpula lacrymans var. lacrymans S7.9]